MKLRISPDLQLPPEAVTETFAILAKRGVGKTYCASVMAEEMLKAALYPVVIVDPIGVWWGLRSSADGKGPGLPIVIFGGDHGDVPLEVGAGQLLADIVAQDRLSVVLDLSRFRKAESVRFMTDFAERLYQRNRQPLHLFLDEADAFAPQRPMKGQERMLGAVEDLVRRGRARGIGVTLVTQRSAVINKDVLTQAEVLVALRTTHPRDRDAIDEWVKVHGEPEQRDELMGSLASLPIGTAWFWSPGWLDVFQRVQIRQRETLDSSATPKVGEKRRVPKRLAPVDLAQIRDRVAETVERAKAEDPRELRRRIAELERELAKAAHLPDPERMEVPVLGDEELSKLEGVASTLQEMGREIVSALSTWSAAGPKAVARDQRPATKKVAQPAASASPPATDAELGKAERAVLSVLVQHGPRSHDQLAMQAGYSARASTIGVALSRLRRLGYVEPGQPIRATDAGLAALGEIEDLPTGQALLNYWRHWVGGTERNVLDVLVDRYPDELSNEELCEATGYSPTASTVGVALSKLRKLELVDSRRRRAADVFMEAIR